MTRRAKLSLGLLGGAILIAMLMVYLRPEAEERKRVEISPLVETIALKPSSGTIPILVIGSVESIEEVIVSAQISGRISYVSPTFREGGLVRAGATLITIEDADYLNQVKIAEADVAAQEVAVQQALQEVEIAREEVRRFKDRRQGNAQIYGDDGSSQIIPPDAVVGGLSEPPAKLGTINPLATREPQLRSAQAAKKRAEANLADARLALKRTRVTAPFSGVVGEESTSRGTLVQPGQSLGSIASTEAFEVRVSITPDEASLIPRLAPGSMRRIPATVSIDQNGALFQWSAFVDRVDAAVDPETRNIEVFLRIPNPLRTARILTEDKAGGMSDRTAPPLLLGSIVNAEIEGATASSYAQVPSVALRPGNVIWVVRDGRLRILPVRLIYRTDATAFITTETLEQGGQLVLSNLSSVTDGQSVRNSNGNAK